MTISHDGALIRVMIVDDQSVIRAGLRMIIDHASDLTVVGEAADGLEAIEVADRCEPDVVVMDIRMPHLDGIETTRRLLAAAQRRIAILVLTTFEDEAYVVGSLRAGASGFLLKDATPEVLLDAIRRAAHGQSLLDAAVTRPLLERWLELEAQTAPVPTPVREFPVLTEREVETWRALAEGLSNREIAEAHFVAEATVKTHVSALLSKLGVRTRVQAVIAAYDAGVVVPRR